MVKPLSDFYELSFADRAFDFSGGGGPGLGRPLQEGYFSSETS
jgi:hypothetical protein